MSKIFKSLKVFLSAESISLSELKKIQELLRKNGAELVPLIEEATIVVYHDFKSVFYLYFFKKI